MFSPSKEQLLLCKRLSQAAYDFELDGFLQDGWRDVTVASGDFFRTGYDAVTREERRDALRVAEKAAGRSHPNLIGQVLSIRQKDNPVIKALVMARPLPRDRWQIAVAFTGTLRKLADWSVNFDVLPDDGFHAGFMRFVREFEELCDRIRFDSIAINMALPILTLSDVLHDLEKADSRFELLVTGHSQGAAAMQIFLYRLFQRGILQQNAKGIGFASPTVTEKFDLSYAMYPVVNIISSDDPVARVGGRMHIGMCMVYPCSNAFREKYYGAVPGTAVWDALMVQLTIRTTKDSFLMMLGLFHAIAELPESDIETMLTAMAFLPDPIAQRLHGYAGRVMRAVLRRAHGRYTAAFGDECDYSYYQNCVRGLFSSYGLKESLTAILTSCMAPHRLGSEGSDKAYTGVLGQTRFINSLWYEGLEPVWEVQPCTTPRRVPRGKLQPACHYPKETHQ